MHVAVVCILHGHTLHLIPSATSHYAHSTLRRTLLWILHFTPHTQLTTMKTLHCALELAPYMSYSMLCSATLHSKDEDIKS